MRKNINVANLLELNQLQPEAVAAAAAAAATQRSHTNTLTQLTRI